MRRVLRVSIWAGLIVSFPSLADVSGTYIDSREPSIALVLSEVADGTITGNFEGLSEAVPLAARRTGDVLVGTIGSGQDAMALRGTVAGETITLVLDAGGVVETHVFVRTGAPAYAAAAPATADLDPGVPAAGAAPAGVGASAAGRRVIVNDERLGDAELARIETTYRVRIVDAEYWYDNVSGAWGLKGGPTRGFIYSGLDIGGPLRADASGGGTNVFINGRELHPMDVMGLQRCVAVLPGRWFVRADGTAGYEGGPPLFNLVSLCSPPSAAGRSGGWLCDGGSCGTSGTVVGPYAVTSEGNGQAGVYTDQGLILTPN